MSEHTALQAARHEHTDVDPRIIWLGAPLVLACVVALALLVLWLYPASTLDRTLRLPLPQYPQPQLQPDPAADMARFYRSEISWLNGTGWVDRSRSIVHIPIDAAMQRLAQQGIPGWPTSYPFAIPAAGDQPGTPGLVRGQPPTSPQPPAP